tara:strand:- start:197 stop:715 length:519 start_codon:yes stop_codon:yes gene_type:complete
VKIDKKQFKDARGRYIVQGLFLEDSYNTDLSVYTFDGEDKLYKGKLYPSLKKAYLEESDVTEYEFAKKYLFDWPHWERLCKNAIVSRHINAWREELTLALRSEGIATLIDLAINDKSYQAAKFLADEGWIKNKRGRPSNEEVEGEVARRAKIEKEFSEDFQLLELHREKKNG